MQLLHIDSSILGDHSVSRLLTKQIVKAELARDANLKVIYRDLAASPLAHFSGINAALTQGMKIEIPPALQPDITSGNAALEEFLASDIVVIGAPMYNFTIPTQLKAWIDRLTINGKTFKYGPNGPEGLAGGKKVIVASTRGGAYSVNTPTAFLDHQETYLRAIFGFLGIREITFIRAEGLAMGDNRAKSIATAEAEIAALA
jgi:FMN-dependent NADH-azoreductase